MHEYGESLLFLKTMSTSFVVSLSFLKDMAQPPINAASGKSHLL